MTNLLAVLALGLLTAEPESARVHPVVGVSFQFGSGEALQEMLRSLKGKDEVPAKVATAAVDSFRENVGFLRFEPAAARVAGQPAEDGHDYHLAITLVVVEGSRSALDAPAEDVDGEDEPAGLPIFAENGLLLELRDRDGNALSPILGNAPSGPAFWYVPFVDSEVIQRAIRDGVIHGTIAKAFGKKLRAQRTAIVRELFARIPLPAGAHVHSSSEWLSEPNPRYRSLLLAAFDYEHLGALPGSELTLTFREPDRGILEWQAAVAVSTRSVADFFGDTEEAKDHFRSRGLAADHTYWKLFPNPVVLVAEDGEAVLEEDVEPRSGGPRRMHEVLLGKRLMEDHGQYHGPLTVRSVHLTSYVASEAALQRTSPVDLLPRNPFDEPQP